MISHPGYYFGYYWLPIEQMPPRIGGIWINKDGTIYQRVSWRVVWLALRRAIAQDWQAVMAHSLIMLALVDRLNRRRANVVQLELWRMAA